MALPFEVTVFVPLVAERKNPFPVEKVIPLERVKFPYKRSPESVNRLPENPVKFKFLALPLPENVSA